MSEQYKIEPGDLVVRNVFGDGIRGRVVKNSAVYSFEADDEPRRIDVRLDDGTMIFGSPVDRWLPLEVVLNGMRAIAEAKHEDEV